MQAVTYIDERKSIRTYRLECIEKFGCSKELFCRLKYARSMTEKMLDKLETRTSVAVTPSHPTTAVLQA